MARQGSFFWRFFLLFWKDSWARDNIIWAAIMVVAPPLAAVLFKISHQDIDWGLIKTTLLLYLSIFIIYVLFRTIRTAWKLDASHLTTIEALEADIDNLKLAAESTKPQFRITIKRVVLDSFYENKDLFVNVRVVNTSNNSTTVERVILKNHNNGSVLIPSSFSLRSFATKETYITSGFSENKTYSNSKRLFDPLTDILPLITSAPVAGSQVCEGWLMFPKSNLEVADTVSFSLELEDMHGSWHASGVVQLPLEQKGVYV